MKRKILFTMYNLISEEDRNKYSYGVPVYQNTRSRKSIDKPLLYEPKKNIIRVCPSKLYNYISGNQIRDVCPMNNWSELSVIRTNNGNEYEKVVIEKIKTDNSFYVNRRLTMDTFNQSKQLIKKKEYDLLFSVPLINKRNNTGGLADVLVKSTAIEKIFGIHYPFKNEVEHYVVIDIKYSENTTEYHKSQLYIYNQALKNIQKYETKCCYLYKKNDKLEMVFFSEDLVKTTRKAVGWIRRLFFFRQFNLSTNSIIDREKIEMRPKNNFLQMILPSSLNESNESDNILHFVRFYYIKLDEMSLQFCNRKPIIWYVSILTINTFTNMKSIKHFFINKPYMYEETKIISLVCEYVYKYRGKIIYWNEDDLDMFPNMFNLRTRFENCTWNEVFRYFKTSHSTIHYNTFLVNAWKYLSKSSEVNLEWFKNFSKQELEAMVQSYRFIHGNLV